MGWTAPGVLARKPLRQTRPSKRKKLEKLAGVNGSSTNLLASQQTVHLPSGPGRRLVPMERLPTEILHEIFLYSDNLNLPSVSILFARELKSPYLYETYTLKAIGNPSRSWFLTRILLSRFFTVAFFENNILRKTNAELQFTLPPELISPKKYELAIALVDQKRAKLTEEMDVYYKSFLEKLCHEKHNAVVRRLLLGAETKDGEDSRMKITPRKETWDYLFKTKDVELCIDCVKEYPFELGFAEDGHKWADLASLGPAGSETMEWLMQTKNIIPPGEGLSGVFASQSGW
ncbi:hypothetical protein BJ508DRAFT_410205 [Ascobolus immersus RN42]|uniref:F-box domain-containing protein n=1 Tax=Ascobolus immersus RN42 TaxID=1160509 RepID=A0A3N4INX5_ASCIM|nr:hypothetical protein BJ508DRAFT_410205 [Ascobolus immersus RN42]